ncbi:hypothetical protein Nepgr_028545 [Nepenthes gracilis]|uniref:Integrator complex subunit 7 n=1 Tax=Nepenthes gracilis TaxID=150966 RepID=A0AAD3TDX9_NEPGR|nr:hypothetical protein Nepgr_028545 [Nepenthes gracilis]
MLDTNGLMCRVSNQLQSTSLSSVGTSRHGLLVEISFSGNRSNSVGTRTTSMDKASAACAMDWSIELEKGLRSKKPGQSIESIRRIGCRLGQWLKGPKLTIAASNMIGLVPGEDRLFADGILLRLASAFASGDKDTRTCIVQVFLSELRHCVKTTRQDHGKFLAMSMNNQLELMRRVKVVLDTGEVDSRALSLIFFGCLADIATNIAQIRYAILSSLFSCHVLEVKASLFAAGCICELSDDFASIFLEMLLNIMASQETLPTVRLAAAQTLAKMGHFASLINKSFKVGTELVQKSSEEDFVIAILISLSKLASKSMALIPEQLGLLFSFLTQKTTTHMQAKVLQCILYIIKRRAYHIPISVYSFDSLLRILEEKDVPSALQCAVLQIFLKVISSTPTDMLLKNMHIFDKLLTLAENSTASTFISVRLLSMRVLVDIPNRLVGRMEPVSGYTCSIPPLSRVVSLVFDRMTPLMKPVLNCCWGSEIEQELLSLLRLLFLLVSNHPGLGYLMLEKFFTLIEQMVDMHGVNVAIRQPTFEIHRISQTGANESALSKFMFCAYKFLATCLKSMYESGAATKQIHCKLKHLVSFVCQCSLFDCSTHIIYSLLLHSPVNLDHPSSQKEKADDIDQNLNRSLHMWLDNKNHIIECARNMLSTDNWFAYMAGKDAACTGAWFLGHFIFQQLTMRVQSHIYSCWLRSLAHFSHSEMNLQVLFSEEVCSDSVNPNSVSSVRGDHIEKLAGICDSLCSAEKIMAPAAFSNQSFCFQRWFLALRVKTIEVVVDILRLLSTVSFCSDRHHEETDDADGISLPQQMKDLICFLVGISLKLRSIVQEYDLLASSLIDIDHKSLKVISTISMGCSLLAFCTGFSYFIPNLSAWKNLTSCTSKGKSDCHHVILFQDLAVRLWNIDSETSVSLMSLSKLHGVPEVFFHSQPRFQISNGGCQSIDILTACRSAIKGVFDMQNESEGVKKEDILSWISNNGKKILLNAIKEWMHIPFRTPECFFKVRPCAGAFLFSSSMDQKNPNDLAVVSGSHLSLNLCLQLKNVPTDVTSQLSKIYCILYCKTSSTDLSGQMLMDYKAWTTDIMIYLHEKLLCYVISHNGESTSYRNGNGRDGAVEAYICFETNGRTQGFSTCLLDVSAFPVGSYRIQWHSCCIDGHGSYRNLLPLNMGPVFTVTKPFSDR